MKKGARGKYDNLYLSKKMVDTIYEYGHGHGKNFDEAKHLVLLAFTVLAMKYNISLQKAIDRVDELDNQKFEFFIDQIISC